MGRGVLNTLPAAGWLAGEGGSDASGWWGAVVACAGCRWWRWWRQWPCSVSQSPCGGDRWCGSGGDEALASVVPGLRRETVTLCWLVTARTTRLLTSIQHFAGALQHFVQTWDYLYGKLIGDFRRLRGILPGCLLPYNSAVNNAALCDSA